MTSASMIDVNFALAIHHLNYRDDKPIVHRKLNG